MVGLGEEVYQATQSRPNGSAASVEPLTPFSVAIVVGVFACWLPARKAAALDPVKAIRYE